MAKKDQSPAVIATQSRAITIAQTVEQVVRRLAIMSAALLCGTELLVPDLLPIVIDPHIAGPIAGGWFGWKLADLGKGGTE